MATASEKVRATAGAGEQETPRDHYLQAEGGDWDALAAEAIEHSDERIVVNMGPQHPSTHGVLRLILELDGETVTEARVGIGYLHTGIEKTMEFRTFTQDFTLCTRCLSYTSAGRPPRSASRPGPGPTTRAASGCSRRITR